MKCIPWITTESLCVRRASRAQNLQQGGGGLHGQWAGRASESREEQVLGQDGLSGEDALGLMLCVELREVKGDGESQEGDRKVRGPVPPWPP